MMKLLNFIPIIPTFGHSYLSILSFFLSSTYTNTRVLGEEEEMERMSKGIIVRK